MAGDLGIIDAGLPGGTLERTGDAAIGQAVADGVAAIDRPEQCALGQLGTADPALDQLAGIGGQEPGRPLAS